MGSRKQGVRWAARAGILALALNALVPVHLAFDLGEALAPAHQDRENGHSLEWRAIAALIGHEANDADDSDADKHDKHHDSTCTCPVIAAFGALTGLVAATAPMLAQPTATTVADLPTPAIDRPAVASTAAYRSRAPPRA